MSIALASIAAATVRAMHIKEIRRARLARLLASLTGRGKQAALAKRLGKAPAQISQWLNGTRSIEEDTARDMERHARLSPGWFDQPPDGTAAGGGIALLAREPDASGFPTRMPWPFKTILFEEVDALSPPQLAKLERCMRDYVGLLLAAAPPPASAKRIAHK